MKLSVHPLIVAAALGLLGPAALAEDEVESEVAPCEGCEPVDSEPAVQEPTTR